jgi:hypothetical protein
MTPCAVRCALCCKLTIEKELLRKWVSAIHGNADAMWEQKWVCGCTDFILEHLIRYTIIVSLDAVVPALFDFSFAARNFTVTIGSNALVTLLAVGIHVTISLAPAKGIDRTGPGAVIAPINQVGIVAGDFTRVDAIINVLALGGARTAKNGVVGSVPIALEADQITRTVVTRVAIAVTHF